MLDYKIENSGTIIITVIKNGVTCTVTEVKGNWGKTPSGWICLDYCRKQ